jgi:hypothetical protein
VLADVVIHSSLLAEALEATVRRVFLVQVPADSLVFKKINNGRDILGNLGEWITVETKVITSPQLMIGFTIVAFLKKPYLPITAIQFGSLGGVTAKRFSKVRPSLQRMRSWLLLKLLNAVGPIEPGSLTSSSSHVEIGIFKPG